MTLTIDVNYKQSEKIITVNLSGSLNTNTSPQLDQKIKELLQEELEVLIFDMKNLEFISSAGLRVVFKTAKQTKAKGINFAIANRQPQIIKVFEIVKALPNLQVFASDDEMDKYLQKIQAKKS